MKLTGLSAIQVIIKLFTGTTIVTKFKNIGDIAVRLVAGEVTNTFRAYSNGFERVEMSDR